MLTKMIATIISMNSSGKARRARGVSSPKSAVTNMAGGIIAPTATRPHLTASLFTGREFGVGPRGERLPHPVVQLVLVQPAVREGGLERVDHMLAIGVRGPQAAMARRCSAFWSCDHRYLPGSTMQAQRSAGPRTDLYMP
jgi:hypothetical protein